MPSIQIEIASRSIVLNIDFYFIGQCQINVMISEAKNESENESRRQWISAVVDNSFYVRKHSHI